MNKMNLCLLCCRDAYFLFPPCRLTIFLKTAVIRFLLNMIVLLQHILSLSLPLSVSLSPSLWHFLSLSLSLSDTLSLSRSCRSLSSMFHQSPTRVAFWFDFFNQSEFSFIDVVYTNIFALTGVFFLTSLEQFLFVFSLFLLTCHLCNVFFLSIHLKLSLSTCSLLHKVSLTVSFLFSIQLSSSFFISFSKYVQWTIPTIPPLLFTRTFSSFLSLIFLSFSPLLSWPAADVSNFSPPASVSPNYFVSLVLVLLSGPFVGCCGSTLCLTCPRSNGLVVRAVACEARGPGFDSSLDQVFFFSPRV